MHSIPITRRALINAGAGLAAVSAMGCTPITLASGSAVTNASKRDSPLAMSFVSIGVIRTAATATAAAEFLTKAPKTASKDLLFLPGLVAELQGAELLTLAKIAQANEVWLVFSGRRGTEWADTLIDNAGQVRQFPRSGSGLGVMPTPLGNVAFASPALSDEKINVPEIILHVGDLPSARYTGAYTISTNAIYSPRGDIIETIFYAKQPLISARIPIAGLRELRGS